MFWPWCPSYWAYSHAILSNKRLREVQLNIFLCVCIIKGPKWDWKNGSVQGLSDVTFEIMLNALSCMCGWAVSLHSVVMGTINWCPAHINWTYVSIDRFPIFNMASLQSGTKQIMFSRLREKQQIRKLELDQQCAWVRCKYGQTVRLLQHKLVFIGIRVQYSAEGT